MYLQHFSLRRAQLRRYFLIHSAGQVCEVCLEESSASFYDYYGDLKYMDMFRIMN